MTVQPGTIEVCEDCEIHLNGALCPDDCKIYQDLKADEDMEEEGNAE